ncbi:chitin deacetylase [Mortierella alpina]|nr:chitin deacetylase [Mortierella alpina]
MALTFDDGPYQFTEALLNTLKTNGVKATFFVNGANYADITSTKYRNLILRAKNEGHQIGSHTWDHKDLAKLNVEQITEEMKKRKSVDQSYNEYKKLVGSSGSGHIVLQHDVYKSTALKLAPMAIALLKDKFKLVTVGTCLGVSEENWYRK